MKRTATPDSRRPLTTRKSRSTSNAESAAVGSSITITLAFSDSALPISASCCSAIDRPRAMRSGSSLTPSRSKIASTCACIALRSMRRPGSQRLAPDEDVLDDGEVREERRLLVDHGDPGVPGIGRPREHQLGAVDEHAAGVGCVHAGEDLDEGRLAGAVLADESVRLARVEIDRDVVERPDRPEALRSVLDREERRPLGGRAAAGASARPSPVGSDGTKDHRILTSHSVGRPAPRMRLGAGRLANNARAGRRSRPAPVPTTRS